MIQYIEHYFIWITFFVAIVALFLWILIILALFMFSRHVKKCDIERPSSTTQTTSSDIFFYDDGLPTIIFTQDFV